MPTTTPTACRSCGAALSSGRCDLCGTPAGDTLDPTTETLPVSSEEQTIRADVSDRSPKAGCPACAHVNPTGARFCNACGTDLGVPASASVRPPLEEPTGERPPSDVGRRAMMFVGGALGVVVGLYALTAFLGNRPAPLDPAPNTTATPAGTAAAVPLPPGDAPPLPGAAAQAQADAFEGEATAEGFYEAARFYLTASYENQQEQPEASRQWAHESVLLLERSLELEDNPDVRIALAEASAFEGVDPMRPIQEAQTVLEANPTHPGANLFIGQRRLMIGRVDAAQEAFEAVIANTEPGDPARTSAESALAMMASRTVPGAQ